MLEYKEIRTAAHALHLTNRADSAALWAVVDAIYKQANRDSNGHLVKGEVERIQVVLSSEEIYFSAERIRKLHRLGGWAKRVVDVDHPETLRNFKVSYSEVARFAGLSVEQAAEKLKSQKWTSVKAFEAAIRTSVSEPESKQAFSLVPDSVEEWIKSLNPPEPERKTTRIVVKPAQTEEEEAEEIRAGLRATQPQMSEERIEELINMFVRGIRPPKSEYDKFIERLDRARVAGEKLYQVMRNAERALVKEYSDEERATFLGGFLFWNDREKVLSADLWINLMGGPSDKEIAQALEDFENGS